MISVFAIAILLVSFWTTRNLTVSHSLALGCYVIGAIASVILWQTYQDVKIAIEEQDARLIKLRKTLKEFDVDVAKDMDCLDLAKQLDELKASRGAIKRQMEKAHIESRKFSAAPSRKVFDELRRKALEDGIKEVQSAREKFESLRRHK